MDRSMATEVKDGVLQVCQWNLTATGGSVYLSGMTVLIRNDVGM
jgi:hypothetical protein